MAVRKPLVLGPSGFPQQLQSGDTIAATSDLSQVTQTADAALIAGNVCYQSAADHVNKAQANASGTAFPSGLVTGAVASSGTGTLQTSGIVALTTTQWDAVAGTTGGLAFGTWYFLDPANAGKLMVTPPTTVGQYVCPVGMAVSATELKIEIGPSILL